MSDITAASEWRQGGPGKTPIDREGVWEARDLPGGIVRSGRYHFHSLDRRCEYIHPNGTPCCCNPPDLLNELSGIEWRRIGDLPGDGGGKPECHGKAEWRDRPWVPGLYFNEGRDGDTYIFEVAEIRDGEPVGHNSVEENDRFGPIPCDTGEKWWLLRPALVGSCGGKGDREAFNNAYGDWWGFADAITGTEFTPRLRSADFDFLESPAGRAALRDYLGDDKTPAVGHEVYVQLIGNGMPEGMSWEEQGKWLWKTFDDARKERDSLSAALAEARKECERLEKSWKCPACDGHGSAGTDYYGEALDCHYCHSKGFIERADFIRTVDTLQERFGDCMGHDIEKQEWAAENARLRSRLSSQDAASEAWTESGELGIAFCEFISEDYPAAIKLLRSLNDVTGLSLQGHAHVS